MAMTLKQAFIEAISRIRADYTEDISSGSASSYDEYRHKAGVIEGISIAEREFLDITSRIEKVN